MKFTKHIIAFIIVFVILFFLSSCQPNEQSYIPPTDAFYINDHANVLLNATKWTIFGYGLELYEDSKQPEFNQNDISGSQVVVLTYLGDVGDFSTTELFNAWGIGENNMGILLVLFFDKQDDEFVYKELVFEIGTKMSEYLSAFEASNLVDTYFDNPSLPSYDYDLKIIHLYFAIMEFLYLNVYEYDSYNYDSFIEEYIENQYEYYGPLPTSDDSIFSLLPVWVWIIIIILFFLFGGNFFPFFIFGRRGGSRFTGGGGKSIGYWFRK